MIIDKRGRDFIQAMRRNVTSKDDVIDVLDFIIGILDREQCKAKSVSQQIRLADLQTLVEDAKVFIKKADNV